MTSARPQDTRAVDFDALGALGGAVWTAQMFEGLFVMVARSALKCPDAKDFNDIAPFSENAFKQPIAALVKELGRASQIDQALADRICAWVELRHTLVHRQVLPLVRMSNEDYWQSIKDLSKQLYVESAELCVALWELYTAYAARIPQAQAWLQDNKESFAAFSEFGKVVRAEVGLSGSKSHG